MKPLMMILLLALVAPAMATGNDSDPHANRYIADDLEIKTLPNNEVVIRLVSNNRITARQFWVDSVYGPRGELLVFEGKNEMARNFNNVRAVPATERQTTNNPWVDLVNFSLKN
jgi:hypothetical protein